MLWRRWSNRSSRFLTHSDRIPPGSQSELQASLRIPASVLFSQEMANDGANVEHRVAHARRIEVDYANDLLTLLIDHDVGTKEVP